MKSIEAIISSLRVAMTDARQNESHFESWMILNEAICDAIDALAAQPAQPQQEPVISTAHGPWIPSTHPGEEGESYCKRCLLRDKFLGSRQCEPHIVEQPAQPDWEAVAADQAMTIALLRAEQELVFSFKMQLKPGWGSQYPSPCVIGDPDLRSLFSKVGDVVTFYTSPPAQRKPLTDEEIDALREKHSEGRGAGWRFDFKGFARAIEAKLKEKNT